MKLVVSDTLSPIRLLAEAHCSVIFVTVNAVMLTSATTKAETSQIYRQFQEMSSGKSDNSDIKLCYVTVRMRLTAYI